MPLSDAAWDFPAGFRFGVLSPALQVEGAGEERGATVWDAFSELPGAIADGTAPRWTADHVRRYRDDVELLRRLGVDSYQFSMSWARVSPAGRGEVDRRGLAFYDRLIEELLEAGIRPMVTLNHYDLPQALEEDGGWLNGATAEAFAEYAALVGARYADRVEHWVPIHSPNVVAFMGYGAGVHAPGRRLAFGAFSAFHHLLLAHGRAVLALRAAGASSVGCANSHAPMWPASAAPVDVGATKLFEAIWNGLATEAMLLGHYPADLAAAFEPYLHDGDLATIRQPLDFYGVSYFNPRRIAAAPRGAEMPFTGLPIVGYPLTDMGWPSVPNALRELLIQLRARFRAALPPMVVIENGASYTMCPDAAGVVDDGPRIDYLAAHLQAVAEAVRLGIDVRGYYVGTFLDGWDWEEGYQQRYGLVHVDFETLARTPKRSFEWYAGVVGEHRRRRVGR